MVLLARALAVLWAAFWLFFFVAESLAFRTPALVAAPWVGVGLLFLVLALVPCRWERGGGFLLVGAGVALGAAYPIWAPPEPSVLSRVITTAILSGPPLLAGMLLLQHHRTLARSN
jgi:hypothetical protein